MMRLPNRKEKREQRICDNCGHLVSFHQLITRDKWSLLFSEKERPSVTHRIPWFCEYQEDKLCGCEDLIPVIVEVET